MERAREEKRRGRVCQNVSGTQGDGNKEERAIEKEDGCIVFEMMAKW